MHRAHHILVTAGHVDHGKSSLVKALTGTDPDRLAEERARGISIELGFACIDLGAEQGEGRGIGRLGIVDVPGHEDFTRTMVGGVGAADLALLVVAADDGWMPQTEEHLQILEYLGVRAGVVALSKADRVDSVAHRLQSVRAELAGTFLEHAPMVPTSVVGAPGLEPLREVLGRVLSGVPVPEDQGRPCLHVDRAFLMKGVGTVVTGTLRWGRLTRGQEVRIWPSGGRARIRSIHNHGEACEAAVPGMRIALSLPEVSVGEEGVRRGSSVVWAGCGGPARMLDAWVWRCPRAGRVHPGQDWRLKPRTGLWIHHGTTGVMGSLTFAGSQGGLAPGEGCVARIRLEAPLLVAEGDRFLLRDGAGRVTLGGGLVLDCDPGRRRFSGQVRSGFLERRAARPADASAWVMSLVEREGAVLRAGLLGRSRFNGGVVTETVRALVAAGAVVARGDWLVDGRRWHEVVRDSAAAVRAHHAAHPNQAGLSLAVFRRGIAAGMLDPALEPLLLEEMGSCGIVREGAVLRSVSHQPFLNKGLAAAARRLREQLEADPWTPPSRKVLVADSASLQALRFLVQRGDVVELNDDLVLLRETYGLAVGRVQVHLRLVGTATASELRQALGLTRRLLIPLLERLDRDGITRREGDRRSLVE